MENRNMENQIQMLKEMLEAAVASYAEYRKAVGELEREYSAENAKCADEAHIAARERLARLHGALDILGLGSVTKLDSLDFSGPTLKTPERAAPPGRG
jgi:hypothetical protein